MERLANALGAAAASASRAATNPTARMPRGREISDSVRRLVQLRSPISSQDCDKHKQASDRRDEAGRS